MPTNREEYQQDSTIRTETLNTEIQEPFNRIERQNNENRNTTPPNTQEQILTQHKMNIDLIKKIMTKKKTALLSLRNQN